MAVQKPVKVAVVGGGAAGMFAALAARRTGAEVVILEKNPRVGRKLLATGNGRCNLTNINMHISNFHGKNPGFAGDALSIFDARKTIEFFERLGIAHKVEEGGKVFPFSNQASSVLDILRYALEESGIEVVCEAPVAKLVKKHGDFIIHAEDGRQYTASRVILATGGKAAPNLGSNGSGYKLAQGLGHSIIEPFPALVQLKLAASFLKQIQGVKVDGDVEIVVKGKTLQKATGEILFTEYGISGPPVLCLSRKAVEYLQKKEKVWLKVVLINSLTAGELDQYLIKRLQWGPNKTLAFNFVGFLNKKLAPVVLREAGIDDVNRPAVSVSREERQGILRILQDWRFEVTGTTSWPAAQVTAGGVDVSEINSRTMESRIVPKLYFAGEVMDIDGDCGGYNLQWAWSSGYVAGENAAKP